VVYGAAPMQGAFDQFRLPPGRHGLPDSLVRENQRWRLLGACAEIIAARGYGGLSLRAVTKEAAVSKDTFYKHFENLGECVAETYAMAAESVLVAAARGCEAAPSGEAGALRGLQSIAGLFSAEPALAYVLADMALLDVPEVHRERAKLAERLAGSLAAAAQGDHGHGRTIDWRLTLHRVRATLGYLSLWLIEGSPATLGEAAPALSQLLQD
jgi:AcrR family transcriptional regulator